MKKTARSLVPVIIILSLFAACKKEIPLSELKKMPAKERSEYFNKLDKAKKIDLFAAYAKNTGFIYPPNDMLLFRDDGAIIHEGEIGGKAKGVIGKWIVKGGILYIDASKKDSVMKSIFGGDSFVIHDLKADPLKSDPPVLSFDLGPSKVTLLCSD